MFNMNSKPTVTHCTFRGNSTDISGGGMYNNQSNPAMANCIFTGNSAQRGGGMRNTQNSNPTLTNCVFMGNWVETRRRPGDIVGGGAMANKNSSPTLTNCTFSGNSADSRGGGMLNESSSSRLTNCILWDDTPEEIYVSGGTPVITYSDVQGGWPGEGNIEADPLFADADCRLQLGSPCIDAGDTSAIPPSVGVDLDGNPRVMNGTVDMGAYEGGTAPTTGIYYVDADATGRNDGSSWVDAHWCLQDALVPAQSGDEIHVAQGIYKPDRQVVRTQLGFQIRSSGDRKDTFQVKDGVIVRGGYAGFGEPDPDARNAGLYETILSGDLNGDDGPAFANNADNSYHVVTGSGADDTAVLDGFTITAGNANGSLQDGTGWGGGMYNDSGGPTVANCTFSRNSAKYGGGMENWASDPILTNCIFSGNSAEYGAGMENAKASPTLANCTFSGNSAMYGAGMENWASDPILTNCTFSGNFAHEGGGMYNAASSYPILINCILWDDGNEIWNGFSIATITYSNIQGTELIADDPWWESVVWGEGNIDTDPLFADPGYWADVNDPNTAAEPNDPNAVWVDGDYHLKSDVGRWDPIGENWVIDDATSPCIDAGDPNGPIGLEPLPNGCIVNMGAYGGTPQASMSPNDVNCISDVGQASNPSPADGAVDVERNVTLSWTAGLDAVSHDIYFGIDDTLPLVGSQTTTEFDPGILHPWTTYLWRIDEVDSEGNKTTGAVWTFTTMLPPPKGRTCFTGETGVWVDGALVPISKVGPGRNAGFIAGPGAGKSSVRPRTLGKVEQVQEHEGVFVCYDVLLETGNCISAIECHYFLTESGRWVALQNLTTQTKLQTLRGQIGIVSVTIRPMPYVGKVYNLKVEGSDRYLVGQDAVVVRDY
jgi:hypothetical protein